MPTKTTTHRRLYTLHQYLDTLDDSRGLTRTLGELTPIRTANGQPFYTAGNSAILFRILRAGQEYALRCYRRPMRHLRELYGDRLLEKELFLFTSPTTGVWVDVVLSDWIAGITLHKALIEAAEAADCERLSALAVAFDLLALELLSQPWAHGDLKPENILVDKMGKLHLIDLDARFLPAFRGEASPELGTAAYQHPTRTPTPADFNAAIDDYPIALISTALHALSLDPSLWIRYSEADGVLFSPQRIATDPALKEVLTRFEHRGMALRYRIASLLFAPSYHLFGLRDLLCCATHPSIPSEQTPELFVEDGRWGYRTPQRVVIPPLYDCGFDFSEGLAAVRIHLTWHFIDTTGAIRLSFPDCEAVKPFREGRALLLRKGHRTAIDHNGNEFDI